MASSFNVNVNDLQYILRQIKIAEASSAAYSAAPKTILQAIMDAYGVTAANAAQLPAGLRTVDGTYNNLLVGLDANGKPFSNYGSADTLFPRLTDPNFQNVNGPGIDFNGDGIIDVINHNYGDINGAAPGGIRSVADADPRLISNLIVDMSVSNPAAIQAFLNNPLSMEAFRAATSLPDTAAEAWLNDPLNVVAANDLMKTIPNQSPDIGLSPGFNSWMTFFGQFFDHGLDLVTKGTNGTVYVPLMADDPLYDKGKDGIANNVVAATDTNGNALYYITDPSLNPVGAPPPATSIVVTAWAAMFNDDGAGADGKFGTADDRPNFMALSRATATIDANGIPQHENTTTSWIDQNQTYTSNASHQVFLREYATVGGKTVATGRLLNGTAAGGSLDGAIGNWAEVKAQALSLLGIKLSDFDVHNVPLLLTDQYGKFIPGANGYAQIVMKPDLMNPNVWYKEGNPDGSVTTAGSIGTGNAFLNDIAHHAAPSLVDHDRNPATAKIQQVADTDMLDFNRDGVVDAQDVVDGTAGVGPGFLSDANGDSVIDMLDLADVNLDGVINATDKVADDRNALTYDDEMLNAHFVTGDGRGNENIALTSVHSIFHSEHNRLVEANKATLLEGATNPQGLAFLNEWLAVDVTAVPTDLSTLVWDGERLFQAARFTTEMQYQHLVFEEFARRIQPMVDPFIFNSSPDIDPSIVAEFAHTVYRFGHSMLTGTVDRLENDLTTVNGEPDQASLLAAFLNPQMYVASGSTVAEANANLIRALSRDVGNAIDEFIVSDVRSTLLGLPLDLAALNIARGRDTGVPSLNETRKQLYEGASAQVADLKPYDSWADFAANIKNPASIINFIAAYGTHSSLTDPLVDTVQEKRDAAVALINAAIAGENSNGAVDFINGTGAYASGGPGGLGGLNDVDLWIGGLAEANPEFGGMLGTTFNYVFEFQMEQLQFGDRMYYLTRTQGLNILNNLEPNTFSDLVMRNTDLGDVYATHLNGALFVTPDYFLELDRKIAQENYGLREYNGADPGSDPTWGVGEPHGILTPYKVMRDYSATTTDANGHDEGGTLRFTGGEHVVVGGTEGRDKIYTDKGIDTLWGDGGNDYLNAGTESDDVFGGEGDDIIEDPFGDDVLRGNQGNDVISDARGANLLFGDEGSDYIMQGQDASQAFGGEGNDFILGGAGKDFLLGNEGDDWIEGGAGFDLIAGDNSELFFNSTVIGHDVLFHGGDEGDYDAESGDDIMGSGPSVFRYEGMFGFDWAIAKNDITGVDFDMAIPIFTTIPNDILRDRFDQTEAFSGWKFDDVLQGDDRGHKGGGSSAPDSIPVELFADHLLTQEGINRIAGLNQWFGGTATGTMDGTDARQTLFGGFTGVPGSTPVSTFRDGNILLGGDGSDSLRGRGGYDLLDGDAWLNVRIKIVVPTGPNAGTYTAESMSTDTVLSGQYAGKVFNTNADGTPDFASPAFGGATLNSLMLNGTINPGNMSIVRELLTDTTNVTGAGMDIDTAFFQGTFAEYQIEGSVDLNADGDFNDAGEFTGAIDVNGDGFISVRDRDTGAVGAIVDGVRGSSRGLLTDDTDLLKNIEQLQFADRLITISGNNNPATGLVTISDPTPFDGKVTPYVGQVLTATLTNVADGNGISVDSNGTPTGPYTFEWQTTEFGSNSGWSTITTSDTYTVRSVDPGHVLRAVAVFKDNLGNTERIISAITDNPTASFNVNENSAPGTVVGARIPFSVDYDPEGINGGPPPDVDLATIVHEIDPAYNSGGRFTVIQNGLDFQGFPLYQLIVNPALNNTGPLDALDTRVLLNYEAPVHTPANQSYQFADNQYQVIINTYNSADVATRILVAQRQFTVLLNDVGEVADIAPTLDLTGDQTLVTNTNGQYLDNFNTAALNNSNGTTTWSNVWVETGDNGGTNSATAGQITIDSGNNNVLRFGDNDTDVGSGTATIERIVNLAGVTSASLSYSYNENSFDAGEIVTVTFSDDGTFSAGHIQTIQTIDGNSNTGSITNVALTGTLTANAAIRFVVSGTNNNSATDAVTIDNLTINTITTTTTIVPGAPGNDYATTYTENDAAVAIASNPAVADLDNAQLMGATVKLTNAQVGDVLSTVGALPAGIIASFGPAVAGEITMYLIGPATLADFQTAIAAVRFGNPAENSPIAGIRTINVTVNDGEKESNIATATVTVVAVEDPTIANNDSIITNTALGTAFVVPEWVLLANDIDLDNTLDVTAIPTTTGLTSVSLVTNPGSVTITDDATANGSFTYTAGGSPTPANANVSVTSLAATEPVNVRDTFGNGGYNNNSGSVNWANNWTETGDGGGNGGANGGDIIVTNFNGSNQLNFNAGVATNDSIQRSVDLSGTTSATLTLNWSDVAADAGENIVVEAWNGTTWDTLGTLLGGDADGNNKSFTANLTAAQLRADGAIRFRDVGGLGNGENLYIDNVNIAFTRPAAVNGTNASNVLVGDANSSTFNGGQGNDIVFAGAGNDTINWSVGDGRDFIDGGAGTLDRVVINGNDNAEVFNVYARTDAISAGITGLNGDTEIVITRDGVVIAELDNIEEITINTSGGNDTVNAVGNFDPTSLAVNTITVNGGQGDDIINISGLTSGHRVVLNSGGGNDSIVGAVRNVDVINDDDVIEGTSSHDVLNGGAGDDHVYGGDGNDRFIASANDGDDEYNGGAGTDTYDASGLSSGVSINLRAGTASGGGVGADKLNSIEHAYGGSRSDAIVGNTSNNTLLGNAGDDYLSGIAGNDSVNGGGGNDTISGGAGRDRLTGDTGNDKFVFTKGFGNDVITDFDALAAGGQDKLDVSGMGISAGNFANRVDIIDQGNDVLIRIDDNNSIRLKDVANINHVTINDFVLFGG